MIIDAGELDTRLYLKKCSDKRDVYGDIKRDIWIDEGSRLGKINHISPKNISFAKGIDESIDAEAKTFYWPEVSTDKKLIARNKTYSVVKVYSDQKQNWTHIYLSTNG